MIKEDLHKITGIYEPWPLWDVLDKLVEASDILLHQHNYDGHGWEEIHHAVKRAKEISAHLKTIEWDTF